MAKTNIGRVSVVPKEEYSSTENYKRLDVVSSNGSMYISKKDNNIGNSLTDKNWWFKAVEKGEVGAQGEKPVNGVDYNTDEEKEEFKNEVVSTATTEVKQNIEIIKEEAIQEFNSNASTKTNEYNDNTTTKLSEYNTNANSKVEEYNSNATQKTNTFNENATTQTETFNNNATSKTNDFNSNASTKTDEFNTNYEEKLESINEASTSIEQERTISDGKYARAFKTQVTDVESTQIYAENDLVDDLVVKGVELTQETREGYNLLNLEKYSYSESQSILNAGTVSIENGILKIDGTNATANMTIKSRSIASENRDLLPAGKYYFGVNTNGYYESSPETLVQFSEGDVTLTENYYLSQWYASCNKGETTNKKLLLSNNPLKTEYEQYGASPSIDFPSEVQVASEQNINISKNNIFNIDNIMGLNGCTIDNNILTTSTMNTYGAFKIAIASNKLFKGTVYLSFDVRVLSGTTNNLNIARFNDALNNVIKLTTIGSLSISSNWTRVKFKTTLEESYELKNIWVQIANATSAVLEIKNIMISYYDVDYEDYYNVNNITIPLINSAIGQYTDTIDRENSVQNKFIQELTLTGSESDWSREDTSVGTRFFKPLKNSIIANATSNKSALCSHFKLALEGETYNNIKNLFAIYNVGSTNRISFGSFTDMSTVEEWKAKLKELYDAGTPVKVYYVAETPTKNSLQEEIQTALSNFKLYQDLNNVAIDGGSMSFIYNKSLSKTIEEMQDEIQSKDTLIQNLTTRVEALEQAQINSVT